MVTKYAFLLSTLNTWYLIQEEMQAQVCRVRTDSLIHGLKSAKISTSQQKLYKIFLIGVGWGFCYQPSEQKKSITSVPELF